MNSKVIFLDIDGVLNCASDFTGKTNKILNKNMISRLNVIKKATGAKCVLSSSWRKSTAHAKFLKKHGVPYFDMTPTDIRGPNLGSYIERGKEIDAWLKKHPEVINYVILDDNGDMLEEQKPFFVQTDWKTGLLQEHVDKTIEILNRRTPFSTIEDSGLCGDPEDCQGTGWCTENEFNEFN